MNELITMNQRQGTLTIAPNRSARVSFRGSYISIISNSATADVIVSADSGMSTPVRSKIGFPTMKLSPDQTTLIPAIFSYVDFTNSSNSETMVVVYFLSLGPVDDNETVIRGAIQMDLSAPTLQTTMGLVVSAAVHTVLPSNALIKERIVQNTGDFPIWWGDESTDPQVKRGLRLNPNGSVVINCWGAVYFKAEGGVGTLSVVNILKV